MLPTLPSLRPDARLRISGQGVELEIGDAVFTVAGAPPPRLLHALSSMNGVLDPAAIGRQSGLGRDTVEAIVERLVAAGALGVAPDVSSAMASAQPGPPLSPEQFNALCAALYAQWKTRLFSHPLWLGLAGGTLPRAVFVGWVVESWWFITGVMDRLPMAIANTEEADIRAVFARHFSEEWDHCHFFATALDALGIPAAQRMQSRPLPATRAVQHWMRRAARADPLRYAACSGFLESTGNDRARARTFFERVGASYDAGDGRGVRPMAEHVALDEEYGHEGFVQKVARKLQRIERERARAALQTAYGLVETLEMWSSDILLHYQAADAFPLRTLRNYRGVRN